MYDPKTQQTDGRDRDLYCPCCQNNLYYHIIYLCTKLCALHLWETGMHVYDFCTCACLPTFQIFDLQNLLNRDIPIFKNFSQNICCFYSSISHKSVNLKETFFTNPNRMYEWLGDFGVECSARSIDLLWSSSSQVFSVQWVGRVWWKALVHSWGGGGGGLEQWVKCPDFWLSNVVCMHEKLVAWKCMHALNMSRLRFILYFS